MKFLQFSGGKDSIACLLLLKNELHDITVLWLNTGAALPETLEQMEKVKEICPNFIEVSSNQASQVEEFGYPVDMLPLRNMKEVQLFTGAKLKLQSFMNCCTTNIMRPLDDATKKLGATTIIRGQKNCDEQKGNLKNGDVVDGITYLFPVETWTDAEVLAYVKPSGLLPKHYDTGNTSLDCWSCTAHLHENAFKLPYLRENHPAKAVELENRFSLIHQELTREMSYLEAAHG